MKRILIVEDNRLERKILSHTIREAFQQEVFIDEAADGSIGLENLQKVDYDMVITDIIMPRIEGLELIRRVKESYPRCKIVAISGSNPYYLYLAKKMGIEGVFTKPFDKIRLIDILSTSLGIQPNQKISA